MPDYNKSEQYPFQKTYMSLNDLCLKLANERPFSDIFEKLQIYVVDYHNGKDLTPFLDDLLTTVVITIKKLEKEDL